MTKNEKMSHMRFFFFQILSVAWTNEFFCLISHFFKLFLGIDICKVYRTETHFLLCPQNKQITMRFVEKSDQEIQCGKLRCSNPIQSTNNFYDLQKYLSTCFYQNVPFTNEEIELIIKNYNEDPPYWPK